MTRLPRILELALALAGGIALGLRLGAGTGAWALAGVPLAAAALLRVLPRARALLVAAAVAAGWALGAAAAAGATRDCRAHFPDGGALVVRGLLEAQPWPGTAAPFRLRMVGRAGADTGGRALACAGTIRVKVRADDGAPARARSGAPGRGGGVPGAGARAELRTGVELVGYGRWWALPPEGRWPQPPERAGVLTLDSVAEASPASPRAGSPLLQARGRAQALTRALFGRRAAVAEALVLAQQTGIDQETMDRFAAAGLVHLLSIGGLHVGLIVAAVLLLARALKLPPRGSSLAAVGAMLAYVAFIGAPVPALRSALQLALVLAARLLQRPTDPRAPVATAAVVILLLWPFSVLDAGFQLSFGGVLGLLTLRRPILDRLPVIGPAWLRDSVATSIAATLATTPIAVAQFGRAAPVGILSNIAAVPLAGLAVPAIGVALLAGTASVELGSFLAGGAGLLLDGVDLIARAAAAIPGGHALVPADQALAWTLAALGAAAVAAAPHPPGASARRPPLPGAPGWAISPGSSGGSAAATSPWSGETRLPAPRRRRWLVAGTALALLLLWPAALRVAGAGYVEIWAIDVGQGDALALRSPGGRWVLVDAGPRDERYDAGRARVVPFLLSHGVRRLDALVLTHPDADHIGGAAAVLRSVPVTAVLEPGVPAGRPLYLETLRAARAGGTRWLAARAGRELRLDGMVLRFLAPRPERLDDEAVEVNEVSVIFALEYGEFRALFLGDAPTDAEAALVDGEAPGALRAALVKVGHHGSATSTGDALLDAARPRGALISVGRHNRFGHPAPATLRRLARRGVRVWRTDEGGTLRVVAGAGGGWRVETAR